MLGQRGRRTDSETDGEALPEQGRTDQPFSFLRSASMEAGGESSRCTRVSGPVNADRSDSNSMQEMMR